MMDEQKEDMTDQEAYPSRLQPKPLTDEWLEEVFRVREQVKKEANGYIFEDSAVVVRREREKRTRELMREVTGQCDKDPCAEGASEEQA